MYRLDGTFPQEPMTKFTDVLKIKHKPQKNISSVLKSLMALRTER